MIQEINYLKRIFKICINFKTKIFIIENVARLVSHNKGKTIREIQESIEKLGYKVKYEILQTSDYNIPQKKTKSFYSRV